MYELIGFSQLPAANVPPFDREVRLGEVNKYDYRSHTWGRVAAELELRPSDSRSQALYIMTSLRGNSKSRKGERTRAGGSLGWNLGGCSCSS